jgi:hypothetical protein
MGLFRSKAELRDDLEAAEAGTAMYRGIEKSILPGEGNDTSAERMDAAKRASELAAEAWRLRRELNG